MDEGLSGTYEVTIKKVVQPKVVIPTVNVKVVTTEPVVTPEVGRPICSKRKEYMRQYMRKKGGQGVTGMAGRLRRADPPAC